MPVEARTFVERTEGNGLLPRGRHLRVELRVQVLVALLAPLAACNQVILQPFDRVTQRPVRVVLFGTITRWIVAGGMRGGAIGHELDECRAAAGTGALRGPLRYRVHREKVVAVDADSRDAVTRAARRERALFAARGSLESGNGPLVVDDVHDDRRLVDGGEQQSVVEIGLGARALADPGARDVIFVADRGRHRPAHGLRKLRCQVAGDRENAPRVPVIHDRQLPALAHVARVRQQLAHQFYDGLAAHHVDALLAIRRKQHVAGQQRHGLRHRDRLLAEGTHVEGNLSLALRALHAVVEDAREQHVAQPHLQVLVFEPRIPGTHGFMFVIEYAHQPDGALFHVTRAGGNLRPGDAAGGRELDIGKVRFVARPGGRLRDVKSCHGARSYSGREWGM